MGSTTKPREEIDGYPTGAHLSGRGSLFEFLYGKLLGDYISSRDDETELREALRGLPEFFRLITNTHTDSDTTSLRGFIEFFSYGNPMHRYRNYHCAVNVRAHFLWHYDSVTVCSSNPLCPDLKDSLDYWLTAQQDVEAQNYVGPGGIDPCDGCDDNKCNYRAKLMASLLYIFIAL